MLKAFKVALNVCIEEFVQGVGAVKELRLSESLCRVHSSKKWRTGVGICLTAGWAPRLPAQCVLRELVCSGEEASGNCFV